MLAMVFSHLRANLVSYLALVVALSTGTAYAAGAVANGSVTTSQLAKNAVTSSKVKNNAIKSSDVKNGSLKAADLASGVLPRSVTLTGVNGGAAPAAVPDFPDLRTVAFTTSGVAYVEFTFNTIGVDCTAGSSFMALYLDGAPVPRTSHLLPTVANRSARSVGAVVTTTPGSHTASIGLDCPTGNPSGSVHFDDDTFVLSQS